MKITNKEMEILYVLWESSEPLTVVQICEFAQKIGKSLKQNTVQATINKLVEKNLVMVSHIIQPNKVLARAFKPCADRDQVSVLMLKEVMGINSDKIPKFLATLIENEKMSDETINELETIIKGLKDK